MTLRIQLVLWCVFLLHSLKSESMQINQLDSSWEFRKSTETTWHRAQVPGSIHTDLFQNKLIPDPFFGTNEQQLQWIDTCDWVYRNIFTCSSQLLGSDEVELIFEGLDTYAEVTLNGERILSADNMFRRWTIPCKKILHVGKNTLQIYFTSAVKKGKGLAAKMPYTLPAEERVITRKAAYQYGWDWGPRFVSCGIWKPVSLLAYNRFHLTDFFIRQESLTDSFAELNAFLTVQGVDSGALSVRIFNRTQGTQELVPVYYRPGINKFKIHLTLANPVKWWCRGTGDPFLYHFQADIADKRGNNDVKNIHLGLRTLELVRENDSAGTGFYFRLNGVPVFMKGANYIPPDHFTTRVDDAKYERILENAVNANMNMLRVWGGGVYESDHFYQLCDQKGILVWQDFMFACAMYPGDSAFLENVRAEIRDNVIRLRQHPCLALWCGNNENDEGWHNWDWQKQFHYSVSDSALIWKDYQKLFHQLIPEVLHAEDSTVSYIPSSPEIGWGHAESLRKGDSHYWGVWWGEEPFENYLVKTGRFMSEYGFQGFPSLKTFEESIDKDSISLNSAQMVNHEKHPSGFKYIRNYMQRDYPIPDNLNSYNYVSQLLQARGIRMAIEAHRRAKPYCMGTLYWQLNDSWPVISWSSTDYSGRWKALHYNVRDAYKTVLVSPLVERNMANVYVISDSLKDIDAQLMMRLISFDGRVLWSMIKDVRLSSNSSVLTYAIDTIQLFSHGDPASSVLSCRIISGNNVLSEGLLYFRSPVSLILTKPNISMNVLSDGEKLLLKSDQLVKNIHISVLDDDQFSDNFFDMLPGKEYVVTSPGAKFSDSNVKIEYLNPK